MKSNFLFPNHFKNVGWVLLGIGILAYAASFIIGQEPAFLNAKMFSIYSHGFMDKPRFFMLIEDNVFMELIGVLSIVGALLVAFSKERFEDEFIAKIRLESLVWAVFFNYFVLLFCMIFIYGMDFLIIMQFNMLTILLFFIARFNYSLHKSKLKQE